MKKSIRRTLGSLLTVLTLGCIAAPPYLMSAPVEPRDLVVHEWGTFTSVQGADGEQMTWNPFQVWDLPGFVYQRNRPDGRTNVSHLAFLLADKGAIQARQRMETPVIYFYSDRSLEVDVEVEFPQGTLTEWYPQATGFGPTVKAFLPPGASEDDRSFLRWSGIVVLGPGTDAGGLLVQSSDPTRHHYFAARATDANVLRVPALGPNGPTTEHEGFLFYRGVGNFEAPLRVSLTRNEDRLLLKNTAADPLTGLQLVEVRDGQGRFLTIGKLAGDEQKNLKLPKSDWMALAELQSELDDRMRQSLVEAGLYVKEAAAMIETWRDSWFGEDGLRVLYVLPRPWTDAALPLRLDPTPDELVRVMVGRAEFLTPSREWEFLRQTVRYADAEESAERMQAVAAVRDLNLGRFAQPLLQRVLGSHPNQEFHQTARTLMNEAARPLADE